MIIFWVTEHDKQVGVEVGIIFGLNYFSFAPIIAEPTFSSNNQYNALREFKVYTIYWKLLRKRETSHFGANFDPSC